MSNLAFTSAHDDIPAEDHFVHMRGATWADYLRHDALRGESAVPRLTFIDGVLEILSPSDNHELLKSRIGRFVEVYCDFAGIEYEIYGSTTLKSSRKKRGAEPDESYVFGPDPRLPMHLAIEVIWTSGGLDKLDVYRKFGVREVWVWRRGRISVHVLRGDGYVDASASEVLPGIDLALLTSFLGAGQTSQARRAYRQALESAAKPQG